MAEELVQNTEFHFVFFKQVKMKGKSTPITFSALKFDGK